MPRSARNTRKPAKPSPAGPRANAARPPAADPLLAALALAARDAGAILLAVSGGSDSTALMHLAAALPARLRRRFAVATVDHGLRPGSRAEARAVARQARALGLPHRILQWRGAKPQSGLQAAARAARYRLLGAEARRIGADALMTAHTEDDQAETFLLRLARGSGVDGLSSMAAEGRLPDPEFEDIRLIRPLLPVSRAALRDWLSTRGVRWIDDPSNADPRFERVKARAALAELAPLGLTAAQIASTARRMRDAREGLEAAAASFLARAAQIDPAGFALLDLPSFRCLQRETALRALRVLLSAVGGAFHAPRAERLVALYDALLAEGPFGGRTLAGCRVAPGGRLGRDAVLIAREAAAVASDPLHLRPGRSALWDGRFRVEAARRAPLGTVRPAAALTPPSAFARLPPAVRATLPVFDTGTIVFWPELGPHKALFRAAFRGTRLPIAPAE